MPVTISEVGVRVVEGVCCGFMSYVTDYVDMLPGFVSFVIAFGTATHEDNYRPIYSRRWSLDMHCHPWYAS